MYHLESHGHESIVLGMIGCSFLDQWDVMTAFGTRNLFWIESELDGVSSPPEPSSISRSFSLLSSSTVPVHNNDQSLSWVKTTRIKQRSPEVHGSETRGLEKKLRSYREQATLSHAMPHSIGGLNLLFTKTSGDTVRWSTNILHQKVLSVSSLLFKCLALWPAVRLWVYSLGSKGEENSHT